MPEEPMTIHGDDDSIFYPAESTDSPLLSEATAQSIDQMIRLLSSDTVNVSELMRFTGGDSINVSNRYQDAGVNLRDLFSGMRYPDGGFNLFSHVETVITHPDAEAMDVDE